MKTIDRKNIIIACLYYGVAIDGGFKFVDLINMMFAFCKENKFNIYNFYPDKLGPFSFEFKYDLRNLIIEKRLEYTKDKLISLDKNDLNFEDIINPEILLKIRQHYDLFDERNLDFLKKYLPRNYPEYYCEINDDDEFSGYFEMIKQKIYNYNELKNNLADNKLISMGYEGKNIDKYFFDVITNKIEVIIDVRANPVSRKFGFSKIKLLQFCKILEIPYFHIPELGIESSQRKNIKDRNKLFENYKIGLDSKIYYIESLEKFVKQAKDENYFFPSSKPRVLLACFEKNYLECHVSVLMKYLKKNREYFKDYKFEHL